MDTEERLDKINEEIVELNKEFNRLFNERNKLIYAQLKKPEVGDVYKEVINEIVSYYRICGTPNITETYTLCLNVEVISYNKDYGNCEYYIVSERKFLATWEKSDFPFDEALETYNKLFSYVKKH